MMPLDDNQDIRIPPHNEAAEQALLGALLTQPDWWDRIRLEPDDWYFPAHAAIHRVAAVERAPAGRLT